MGDLFGDWVPGEWIESNLIKRIESDMGLWAFLNFCIFKNLTKKIERIG